MLENESIIAATLRQALTAKAKKNIMAIAGGTDLLVKLHDTIDTPNPKLLVLDYIKSLHKIVINSKRQISIGPLVTFDEIEQSQLLRQFAPQLVAAASLAGSAQIRNQATIGGNIANASPAGDLIPPLYALDAKLELSSIKGKRHVPIEDFFLGPGKSILKSSELITSIKIMARPGFAFFLRLATRQALAISKVSVAAGIRIDKGIVDEVYIALGAVAPTVIRASETEKILIGKELIQENICHAAEIAKSEARPIDDIRSNAEYRREMVAVLLSRGLTQIASKLA